MIILNEYDAMQRIIEGLSMARDGARMMAAHRPDQAHQWDKAAAGYEVAREIAYKISEEAAKKVIKS